MNKTPAILTTAALAAIGISAGGVAANAQSPTASSAAAKPAVRDLDIDLVRGSTFVMTVEARRAKTVKITYRGTTKTARLDRDDDGDDRDRDYVARFTAASGDRQDNTRVSAKVRATNGSKATTRTLSDRIDVEDGDDD